MSVRRSFTVGRGLTCDIDRLITSRLLLQANSGGGKTRTMRRLLEQTHGHLQQLVIDPEGEYSTLREKFDYILAAPSGGDTVAHPRTAKLLAHRLLELGVSAIVDIYELNPDARHAFVKQFLTALVDAPRALWHPTLVVLDEAHVYAPEGKESESTSAVKAMASRGRKRGFCLVPATQRLSKLAKDVAAECNNKLIGRCTLDVDIKRAAEELGFTANDQKMSLRQLEPGQFYAYGPAFTAADAPGGVSLVMVGGIQTSHPEPGQQAAPVPPPTAKVRKVLQALADLPAEAEAREKSIEDLKRDNATLRRQLTEAQKAQPKAVEHVVEKPVLTESQIARFEKSIARLGEIQTGMRDKLLAVYEPLTAACADILTAIRRAHGSVHTGGFPRGVAHPVRSGGLDGRTVSPRARVPQDRSDARVGRRESTTGYSEGGSLPPGEKAILIAAAQYPTGLTREQATVLTGYKRSSRDTYIQRLVARGYVETRSGGVVAVTPEGMAALGDDYQPLPSGAALQSYWLDRLPVGERKILEVLVGSYPQDVPREALTDHVGYKRSSRDTYIQRLVARQLVTSDRGTVRASDVLFEG